MEKRRLLLLATAGIYFIAIMLILAEVFIVSIPAWLFVGFSIHIKTVRSIK